MAALCEQSWTCSSRSAMGVAAGEPGSRDLPSPTRRTSKTRMGQRSCGCWDGAGRAPARHGPLGSGDQDGPILPVRGVQRASERSYLGKRGLKNKCSRVSGHRERLARRGAKPLVPRPCGCPRLSSIRSARQHRLRRRIVGATEAGSGAGVGPGAAPAASCR